MIDLPPDVVRKRSVVIAGHATSVSIESAFWLLLNRFAADQGRSINQVVTEIDRQRGGNLSSAIRLWVLEECCRRAGLDPSADASSASTG